MKHLKILSILFLIVSIAGACAPQAAPTINAADVQSTAAAAAFTMVAQTQAAIPTATPLPPTESPTETPLPTNTSVALPTLEVTSTTAALSAPTTSGNATVDPCSNRQLGSSPQGKPTVIRLANTTKAQVTVSLYLNETASHGECGYRSYVIGKSNDVTISDLVQGCYSLWAWSTDNSSVHVNGGGGGCINNDDKWTFEIKEDSIKFVGP
jgi:hypothetical protein